MQLQVSFRGVNDLVENVVLININICREIASRITCIIEWYTFTILK